MDICSGFEHQFYTKHIQTFSEVICFSWNVTDSVNSNFLWTSEFFFVHRENGTLRINALAQVGIITKENRDEPRPARRKDVIASIPEGTSELECLPLTDIAWT